ncbi:MAG: hypothetical protein WB646_11645 [Steroidobacteraceae bacterium]
MRALRPAGAAIALVALLAVVLVVLNRGVLGTPTGISFGFAHVTVPLGLALLGFALLLLALFFGLLLRIQLRVLATHRRHSAELRQHRQLVENAEASRYTDLRLYLQQELAALREQQRLSEQRLHDQLVSTVNSLSACVGEIDERLERHFPTPPSQLP